MPDTLTACVACEPESPFAGDDPWPIWAHRRLSEIFTLTGRRRWNNVTKPGIVKIHRAYERQKNKPVETGGRLFPVTPVKNWTCVDCRMGDCGNCKTRDHRPIGGDLCVCRHGMFFVTVEADYSLTKDEIWPDGNAPVSPTDEDVVREMVKSSKGNAKVLLDEWDMDGDFDITVGMVSFWDVARRMQAEKDG